jgi:hypothetical protein
MLGLVSPIAHMRALLRSLEIGRYLAVVLPGMQTVEQW